LYGFACLYVCSIEREVIPTDYTMRKARLKPVLEGKPNFPSSPIPNVRLRKIINQQKLHAMDTLNKMEVLRKLPVLASLNSTELEQLASISTLRRTPK